MLELYSPLFKQLHNSWSQNRLIMFPRVVPSPRNDLARRALHLPHVQV